MQREISLNLDDYRELWQFNEEKKYWFLEDVAYCQNPSVPELQRMNLCVPAAYRDRDGNWILEGACGGFTCRTVPVILENNIGGYAESRPSKVREGGSWMEFIEAGMIFVSPGTRGKQTISADGKWIGKSPAGLVDLKCAVRFLKHNRGKLAGDMDKIVSVGVSAGGAMSALLGTTGNNERYVPYLEECGAAMDAGDDIFGAQCYCPILDLEHADMAYEWMFSGMREYTGRPMTGGGVLDDFRMALSEGLKSRYIRYFNGLSLKNPETGEALFLSEDGKGGTAVDYLVRVLNQAARKHEETQNGEWASARHGGNVETVLYGANTHITDAASMRKSWPGRLKTCPAFDDLDNCQAENQEFGDCEHNFLHFDENVAAVLAEIKDRFPEQYEKYSPEYEKIAEDEELKERIFLINPLNFIGTGEKSCLAPHFRIRVGTQDPHTSFTVAMTLALKLMGTSACNAKTGGCDAKLGAGGAAGNGADAKTGACSAKTDVDYKMVWNAVHEKADYPGELVQWIRRIADNTKEEGERL